MLRDFLLLYLVGVLVSMLGVISIYRKGGKPIVSWQLGEWVVFFVISMFLILIVVWHYSEKIARFLLKERSFRK